jgi:hypothetical protein
MSHPEITWVVEPRSTRQESHEASDDDDEVLLD